jgi:hypothetical protein
MAIVLSKLAIWIALDVGISLLSAQAQSVVPGGQAWGEMIAGSAILAVALFAPFVVWRLLPVAEAAVIAQGLSRQPGRAATQGLYLSSALGRFGRQTGSSGAARPFAAPTPSPPTGLLPGVQLPGGGSPAAAGPGAEASVGPGAGAALPAGAGDKVLGSAASHAPPSPEGGSQGWSFMPPDAGR